MENSPPIAEFWEGCMKSCAMVLMSEIGDKTFFIAAVMAMRNPRLPVWSNPLEARNMTLPSVHTHVLLCSSILFPGVADTAMDCHLTVKESSSISPWEFSRD